MAKKIDWHYHRPGWTSCTRATKFLAANKIDIKEEVRASQKLNAGDAKKILKAADKLIVAKGKKLSEFSVAASVKKDAVEAMLGPTGNLRAPTLIIGKTVMVGFNEETYQKLFE